MLTASYTTRFKKDVRRMEKRGCDISALLQVMGLLVQEVPLPDANRDHALSGNWAGFRDCHVKPDWVLIYAVQDDEIVFARTGSHVDVGLV